MKRFSPLLACSAVLAATSPALADPPCGAVEVRFKPAAPNMQIVVWIEDAGGNFKDTPYITRLTGQFGLGNRPGAALLKTDFGWPYGRREMVAPIWAHRRNKQYPKVVMGGVCGNSPSTLCPGGSPCGGDCEDSTIAYHSRVSSYEPFYCSPTGASRVDAMSCASKGTFSKGAYLPFPQQFSLYPPRADLNAYDKNVDSADLMDFKVRNDLVAVSQATPPSGKVLDPSLLWFPPGGLTPGNYVAWIELSQEYDFNTFHNHPNQPDSVTSWDFEGHAFLGQPSIVYKVPFTYTTAGSVAITTSYAGYSTWDGSDGTIHPPDGTITTNMPGSGAGRLADVDDGIDVYRVKVLVGSCGGPMPDMAMSGGDGGSVGDDGGSIASDDGGSPVDAGVADMSVIIPSCGVPDPVTDLVLTPHATSIDVSFKGPTSGQMPYSYSVRYREASTAITDEEFDGANAAPSVSASGGTMAVTIDHLQAKKAYAIAVRGNAPCAGKFSKVMSSVAMTEEQKFTTLSGCFVATAAWGSELETHVASLRQFRDTKLLTNPAGQLFVAGYYAFGPYLAGAISKDEHLRSLARTALTPLVAAVTHK